MKLTLKTQWIARLKLWAEGSKLWAEGNELWAAYLSKYHQELEALHATECPNCPWNGRTIFP